MISQDNDILLLCDSAKKEREKERKKERKTEKGKKQRKKGWKKKGSRTEGKER